MNDKKPLQQSKAGFVTLIGRPNAGKSTLLNNILKHKVAITSPKPQTTRFSLQAVYEDERGQIVFTDTPGIFGKSRDSLSKKINKSAEKSLSEDTDVIVYLIDHTRKRDFEENKILGIVRKIQRPKILAFNKTDIKKPDYTVQYLFMKDEFDENLEISALTRANLNFLLDAIFKYLPIQEKIIDTTDQAFPGLNIDSKLFISEIIREKAFLFTRKEIPYSITTNVSEIEERDNGTLYIKGAIVTSAKRYKGMIVGSKGRRIKEIGMAVRKELETATGKKVFIDLSVDVNPHWQEQM